MSREGPRGPGRCTRCGAEGVNRATCTGDKTSHEELGKGYTGPHLNTGNPSGNQYKKEYDDVDVDIDAAAQEVEMDSSEYFEGEIVYTPPARVHNLVKTTMTFITSTPIALENCTRLAIQEADLEHIWLDTEFLDVEV